MNYRTIIIRSNQVAPDSRVEKEAAALAEKGYNVKILAWDRRETHATTEDILDAFGHKIPIIRFGHKANFGDGIKSLKAYLGFQWDIFHWLIKNRKQYDLIHACDFDTALTSSLANIFLRKLFIFDIFDYIGGGRKSLSQKILCKIQNNIINRSDATIICTDDRKRQIEPSKPKRLVVIHNTPPKIQNVDNYISPHNPIKICYVGILQNLRLLEEIPQFFIKHPEIEFNIGGFGKFESLYKELSSKYPNIKYYGRLDYSATLKLESECDIILAIYDPKVENHKFAAPNKFYEALMIGKPLIMAKETGMSGIVDQFSIGETIEYSIDGFEQGILKLIERKDEWKEIHDKMNSIYMEYSWDEMKSRLINLYMEVFKTKN